eukprot:8774552-Pyramimonas_sp.AAC.1
MIKFSLHCSARTASTRKKRRLATASQIANPLAKRVKSDILDSLNEMDDEGGAVGSMARLGFLQIFRDPELGEEFAQMDFTRLRQGAHSSAMPPPGWTPST